MSRASELLIGLSVEELEALADGKLAPTAQGRLDELLARRKVQPLSAEEETELDSLLQKSDQLTILKTRARYTLNQAKRKRPGHDRLHFRRTPEASSCEAPPIALSG